VWVLGWSCAITHTFKKKLKTYFFNKAYSWYRSTSNCNTPLVTPGVNGAVEMTLFVFCICISKCHIWTETKMAVATILDIDKVMKLLNRWSDFHKIWQQSRPYYVLSDSGDKYDVLAKARWRLLLFLILKICYDFPTIGAISTRFDCKVDPVIRRLFLSNTALCQKPKWFQPLIAILNVERVHFSPNFHQIWQQSRPCYILSDSNVNYDRPRHLAVMYNRNDALL